MANLFKLNQPTLILFEGRDRNKVLNNLATQDYRELKSGQASETFVTDPKGKAFGHGIAFAHADQAYFVTVAGQGGRLVPHFDRFIIMEDATVQDVSDRFDFWIVRDPSQLQETPEWKSFSPLSPSEQLQFTSPIDGNELMSVAAPWISQYSCLLIAASERIPSELAKLFAQSPEWKLNSRTEWEGERIAANWPWYGVDFDEKNLPQEIDRDPMAISFNKGCYLGQETIARLDALGQVQKKLVRLRLQSVPASDLPTLCSLHAGDSEVGSIRSFAPAAVAGGDDQGGIAFGFVKRSHFASGTELTVQPGGIQAIVE